MNLFNKVFEILYYDKVQTMFDKMRNEPDLVEARLEFDQALVNLKRSSAELEKTQKETELLIIRKLLIRNI